MTIAMFFPALLLAITRTEEILATTRPSALHHRHADVSARVATAPRTQGFRAHIFLEVLFGEVASLHVELELPDIPETVVFPGVFGGHVLRARIPYSIVRDSEISGEMYDATT